MGRIGYYICVLLALWFGGEAQAAGGGVRWARISVPSNGLYVLGAEELRSLGFSSVERVRVWGWGGALLPEAIVLSAGRGLEEVPTLLEGGSLYFYGMGPVQWSYARESDFFRHTTNHYARAGYYLLSEGGEPMRMQTLAAERPGTPAPDADTYVATVLHEVDAYSPSGTGRRLYGESFQANTRRSYTHSVPYARSVRAAMDVMAFPRAADATFRLSVGGGVPAVNATVDLASMNALVRSSSYHVYGLHRSALGTARIPTASNAIEVTIESNTSGAVAHLDHYELNVVAGLVYSGGQLSFCRPARGGSATTDYVLEGFDGGMRLLRTDRSGSAHLVQTDNIRVGDRLVMSLPATDERTGQPSRYLALRLSDAFRPQLHGVISLRNLLSATEAPDLFIITTEALRGESERLAAHYRTSGHSVLVATQQEIFDEFNGGTPDATAYRLALRHMADVYKASRGGTDVGMQLLLVGDGAQDNRKVTADWQIPTLEQTEFLLTYQSENSLDLSSYTSDDYYGVLSDERPRSGTGYTASYPRLHELPMDIGVGRLPVRSPAQASAVVSKIIRYETVRDYGTWRMRAAFVADNGDGNSHTRQSIEISDQLEAARPELRLDKIYLSAYPRQSVNGKVTVPGAKKALRESLERGVLFINYNGHGSPKSWTDEQVLTLPDIQGFTYPHLPLWITATCDFANFDALATSSGEEVLLHPTSGGVALLSTTRVVYDLPNVLLNKAVLRELFRPDSDGKYRPLGTVIRDAKNSLRLLSSPENRLNFVLLGSPLTRIQLPPTYAQVSSIGGQSTQTHTAIELRSLQRVALEGYIQTQDGSVNGDFSGNIHITVYDAEQEQETVDNFSPSGRTVSPVTFRNYDHIIYSGTTKVTDGRYAMEFIVPRDVSYSGRRGLVSLYAWDSVRSVEAIGQDKHIMIRAGQPTDIVVDTVGPQILSLRLGGQEVSEQMRVPETIEFYALFKDETAINLSGAGLGHRVNLIIEGYQDQTYDLSRYYTPVADSVGLGTIHFRLEGLRTGLNRARLLVWDVYNNPTVREFSFYVQPGLAPSIHSLKVISADNTDAASLYFGYDQAGSELQADIYIYDMSGRIVTHLPTISIRSLGNANPISTIPMGEHLAVLPPGAYVIRLALGAPNGARSYASTKWQRMRK